MRAPGSLSQLVVACTLFACASTTALCACASTAPPPATPAERAANQPVLRLVPSAPSRVRAGDSGEITLQLRIAPGYHVMSDQPSAAQYIATRVALAPSDDVSWEPTRFPPAQVFFVSEHAIAAFTGELTISIPFRVADDATLGPREFTGSISYQACTESDCLFPTSEPFSVRVTVTAQ